MILVNKSSYPTPEVAALIAFAAESYDLRRVLVIVRDTPHPYRGLAYRQVPLRYRRLAPSAQHMVVVYVGPPAKFAEPVDNLRTRRRWVPIAADEIPPLAVKTRTQFYHVDGVQQRRRQKLVVTRAPYGGRGSPLVIFNTWDEAMVGVAAHEFHHIRQYKENMPVREHFCERAALAALTRYRAKNQAGVGSMPPA